MPRQGETCTYPIDPSAWRPKAGPTVVTACDTPCHSSFRSKSDLLVMSTLFSKKSCPGPGRLFLSYSCSSLSDLCEVATTFLPVLTSYMQQTSHLQLVCRPVCSCITACRDLHHARLFCPRSCIPLPPLLDPVGLWPQTPTQHRRGAG